MQKALAGVRRNLLMEKYLHNYAEPENEALDSLCEALGSRAPWTNVLVIPACNESSRFLRSPPPGSGRSLLVLVVNETESALPEVTLNNRALAASVRETLEPLWRCSPESSGTRGRAGLELYQDPAHPRDVLLVDRFSPGRRLPVKGGVGHARKTGADLAAGLRHRGMVQSEWIHCSDADVNLPQTYFSCSAPGFSPGPDTAALVYPFRHVSRPGPPEQELVMLATRLYELSLHYYVSGLKFAGSPYAFHTIGSTIAVSALHYAKVRGFPKREAGEDFYLLNKLAKVGRVVQLEERAGCEAIEIEARRSDRVPFGTGAAVNAITALNDPLSEFRYYHPAVFDLLKSWLQSWPAIWQSNPAEYAPFIQPGSPSGGEPGRRRQALLAALEQIGAGNALDHAFRHSSDFRQFSRQMHTWFDAFRTLKLIHLLRDNVLPSVSFSSLRASPLFGHLFDDILLEVDR